MPVLIGPYFKVIENFVNQDREEHLKFLFKVFDVFNEDKITQAGLFKFMQDASIPRGDLPTDPTDILNLNESEVDIFLDIFTTTYSKIVEALAIKTYKKKAMKLKAEAKSKARAQNSVLPPVHQMGATA